MNGNPGMLLVGRGGFAFQAPNSQCKSKPSIVILSRAKRSRRIPYAYLKTNITGSLDFAGNDSEGTPASQIMKQFWLAKQEPSSYSWSDFVAVEETSWTGVRNFAARNNLRKIQKGDEVFFYHSGDEKAVVGIAKVTRTAYRDPTAKEGDWSAVDIAAVKALRRPVTLREIKGNPQLKRIPLVRQPRLSVMPLSEAEFREIVKMASLR